MQIADVAHATNTKGVSNMDVKTDKYLVVLQTVHERPRLIAVSHLNSELAVHVMWQLGSRRSLRCPVIVGLVGGSSGWRGW